MNWADVSGGNTSVTNKNEANANPRTGAGTRFQIAKKPGRNAIKWAVSTVSAIVQKTTVGTGEPAPDVGTNIRSKTCIAIPKFGERNRTNASVTAKNVVATRNNVPGADCNRSEEHTSELQSRFDLVCRLLLAKINKRL